MFLGESLTDMNTKTKKYQDYDQNELVEAAAYLHIRTSNIQHRESLLQPITVDFDDELHHAYFSQEELTLLNILKTKEYSNTH